MQMHSRGPVRGTFRGDMTEVEVVVVVAVAGGVAVVGRRRRRKDEEESWKGWKGDERGRELRTRTRKKTSFLNI